MAVYTHLSAEDLEDLIGHYEVGTLVSAKGIAEGVSNSNWLIETTGSEPSGTRFVLTMYERRIAIADLPFFLGLLDFLSAHDCPVPRTIHDRGGAAFRLVGGKAVALIEFLPGVSLDRPTPDQAHSVGAALARVHLAAVDYSHERKNNLTIQDSLNTLASRQVDDLARIDDDLPQMVSIAQALVQDWPEDLPRSIIHSDLFPDNVLMMGTQVTGMIDFYFACNDAMAYDLAVTHAAWSFDKHGRAFASDVGRALLEGYESLRPLSDRERASLAILAQGACMRFIASRAEDWIETPEDALVTRKDPMDFVRRLEFYRSQGENAFA